MSSHWSSAPVFCCELTSSLCVTHDVRPLAEITAICSQELASFVQYGQKSPALHAGELPSFSSSMSGTTALTSILNDVTVNKPRYMYARQGFVRTVAAGLPPLAACEASAMAAPAGRRTALRAAQDRQEFQNLQTQNHRSVDSPRLCRQKLQARRPHVSSWIRHEYRSLHFTTTAAEDSLGCHTS